MTTSPGPAANGGSVPITERRFLLPFFLITTLFFLWAFGVNLNDILIPHLKKAFGLTDFQSSFIQVAFFGGYFLAAFPAGRVMEKIGYKKGILAGLFLCAAGAVLFLPASSSRVYGFFLFALFVMSLLDDRRHFRGCRGADPIGAPARRTGNGRRRRSGGDGKERGERAISRASCERGHRAIFF